MIAIGEHVPLATDHAVDRSRETYGQAGHSPREGHLVRCFDDQMHVVGLHRELHHAKPLAPRVGEGPSKGHEDRLLAQAG